MSSGLGQALNTSLQQHQQLLMNLSMQQALHVLQLPQLELAEWLKQEIESNPVLEIDLSKETFKEPLEHTHTYSSSKFPDKVQQEAERRRREHQENSLQATSSLYTHLTQQASLVFTDPQELQEATWVIGHLNEKGFLDTPLEELALSIPLQRLQQIVQKIQTLDPPGVGATSLQESLLIQLRLSRHRSALGERILQEHFENLLHNKINTIAEQLREPVEIVSQTIAQEIVPLDLHPGYRFSPQPITAIIPDLFFVSIDGTWRVEVNTAYLPQFHLSPLYTQALQHTTLNKEEFFYLRRQLMGGRWLKKIVQRRHQTLIAIGNFILTKQKAFFDEDAQGLVSLTMQDAADALHLHESTIARAVANKYVSCPEGIFSLRTFFHQGVATAQGPKISNHSLRKMLKKMIDKEDKRSPLSDEAIAHKFHKWGIRCARRTITKYRSTLKIAPAAQRKKF